MGMKLFSDSCPCPTQRHPVDPDPKKFRIKEVKLLQERRKIFPEQLYTYALINYPNCTTYRGDKILVYAGDARMILQNMNSIDPHFLEDHLSPLMRLAPTLQGLGLLNRLFVEVK